MKVPQEVLCCIVDHRSRLMLALREFWTKGSSDFGDLFRDAKELAGGIPKILLSDAEASIAKAARQTLQKSRDGTVLPAFHNTGAPTYAGKGRPAGRRGSSAPWPGGRAGTGSPAGPTAAAQGA